MMKVIASVFILLLLCFDLFADNYSIIYLENGFSFSIDNIEYKILERDGVKIANQSDNDFKSKIFDDSIVAYDYISFKIAAPTQEFPTLSIDKVEFQKLFNYNIKAFEIATPKDFLISSSTVEEIKYAISYLGLLRGVHIFRLDIYPYKFDVKARSVLACSSLKVNVSFNNSIDENSNIRSKPTLNKKNTSNEISFPYSVINSEQIPDFIPNTSNAKIDGIQNVDWYNPNKEYVKLGTKSDGVAKISFGEILNLRPSWAGKLLSSFHLIHNGRDYPSFIQSADQFLSNDDNLIFFGRRPYGDSLWFDNGKIFSQFFLLFDEQKNPLRLKVSDEIISQKVYDGNVSINKHIEYDTDYFYGKNIADHNKSELEDYYWSILDQLVPRHFEADLPIIGDPESNEIINIKFSVNYLDSVFSYSSGRWEFPYYNVSTMLNGDTTHKREFNLINNQLYDYNIESKKLISGINRLDYNSIPNEIIRSGFSFIDYILIRANVKSFAINNQLSFQVTPQPDDFIIRIPGFSSQEIIAIDTTSSTIYFPTSKNGFHYSVGAKSGNGFAGTLILGDSSYYSNKSGLHIGYIAPQSSKTEMYHFPNPDNSSVSTLTSIPDGSIVCGMILSSEIVNKDLIDYFKSLGFNKLSSDLNNRPWVFAYQKGGAYISENAELNTTSLNGFIEFENANFYRADLALPKNYSHKIEIFSSQQFIKPVLNAVEQKDLKENISGSELIIITHKLFKSEAQRLAKHREEFSGISSIVVDVESIYNTFSFGHRSPQAIRDYLQYAFSSWTNKPKYAIMFGDASWEAAKLLSASKRDDFVPTYGFPVTDYWYGCVDGNDDLAEIIIGRLPVSSVEESINMVNKLIYYDTLSSASWMKDFLWMSGGLTEVEREWFYLQGSTYFLDLAYNGNYCADTSYIRKLEPQAGAEQESNQIKKSINDGKLWICYLGHASAEIFDMDGWQVDRLNNFGKYAFLTTISCSIGDFGHHFINSRNETYVLAPDKGFIAAGGGSTTSLVNVDREIIRSGMISMNKLNYRRIGDIIYHGKFEMNDGTFSAKRGLYFFQIIGDPTTSLKIDTLPDFYISSNSLSVKSSTGNSIIDEQDGFVNINAVINNAGLIQIGELIVKIEHEYEGTKNINFHTFSDVCRDMNFNFNLDILNKPGKHSLSIIIDPDNLITENNKFNNTISTSFDVFTAGLLKLDPQEYWSVNPDKPWFRFINPRSSTGEFSYEFAILTGADTNSNIAYQSKSNEIEIWENSVDWKPDIVLPRDSLFWIKARLVNKSDGGKLSSWLLIPINTFKQNNQKQSRVQLQDNLLKNLNLINLDLDTINLLKLKKDYIPYHVFGATGGIGANTIRYSKIVVGDIEYVNREYSRGINIVTVDMYSGRGRLRIYDTWNDEDECRRMSEFLTDSVSSQEYLFLATNDLALKAPFKIDSSKPGSINDFRRILKRFGSIAVEDLNDTASFAFFGFLGASANEIHEQVNLFKDSAMVEGNIAIFSESGSLQTEWFGPAESWNQLKIESNLNFANDKSIITIEGRTPIGQIERIAEQYVSEINLDEINASEYPYIRLRIDIKSDDRNDNQFIQSIRLDYNPTAEFAIIKSESNLDENLIMRGFENEFSYVVENLSLRSSINNQDFLAQIKSNDGTTFFDFPIQIQNLEPNEKYKGNIEFKTNQLATQNQIDLSLDINNDMNELYTFNNQFSIPFSVFEDIDLPEIELYANGTIVKNYDFLTLQPNFEIIMRDNSPLDIDSSMIRVRLNGKIISKDNSKFYNFSKTTNTAGEKGRLQFIQSDSLTYTLNIDSEQPKANLLTIYIVDASGNRDTSDYYLNVAKYGSIKDYLTYPNPFSDKVKFKLTYKTPNLGDNAMIRIYNQLGQQIRTLEAAVVNGENFFEWDGKDQFGNSIPIGLYYYYLQVESDSYIEPITGVMSLVR